MVKKTDTALKALAIQDTPGKLNHRLELAIDAATDAAITAVAGELAGSGDPGGFRSKAARLILAKGAAAILAERAARA